MTTAVDVMKYIKSRMSLNGEVQLQKLAYYCQAWSLAWDGTPLFEDRIQAWKLGPVVPALRFREDSADPSALGPAERATVDAVISFYGKHPGYTLIDMTHDEEPWASAWDGTDRCRTEITHESMRQFYTRQLLTGVETPVRSVEYEVADDNEVSQIAAANAVRWRETLEILSR
jgi:uncharacterized phage-associated protein